MNEHKLSISIKLLLVIIIRYLNLFYKFKYNWHKNLLFSSRIPHINKSSPQNLKSLKDHLGPKIKIFQMNKKTLLLVYKISFPSIYLHNTINQIIIKFWHNSCMKLTPKCQNFLYIKMTHLSHISPNNKSLSLKISIGKCLNSYCFYSNFRDF